MSAVQDLQTRFGDTVDAATLRLNPFIETLLAHRSVRQFLAGPLPAGTLETLAAAAQSAASSSNLQAFSVVAVESAERKDRLATLAGNQQHVRDCPLLLMWVADLSRLARVSAGQPGEAGATRFLEMFVVAVVDAALAAQNAVLAAESLGLGTVYIGGMRNQPQAVARELNLPPQAFVAFGLCVGQPDPARPAEIKPRLAPELVVHREQYRVDHEPQGVAAFDTRMQDFQASQGMPVQPWSTQAAARVAGPGSLSGRDVLAAALRELGLPLE